MVLMWGKWIKFNVKTFTSFNLVALSHCVEIFFKGKTCSKSRDPLNKEVNNEMIETSDLGFASNSSSASLVDPSKDEPREISKDRLIIAEDENGFIVMKIQKASDF